MRLGSVGQGPWALLVAANLSGERDMAMRIRNNVVVSGGTGRPMLFAHGFGCDQEMWRFVEPAFRNSHATVLYDLTGHGTSDLSAYDFDRYATLAGHARDIVDICDELDLEQVVVVGHSVSAITAVLAASIDPRRFGFLVLLAPSPCFMNDGDYHGGFSRDDLEGLIAFMDENYFGWAEQLAPTIAGQSAGGPAATDLTQSFCRTDPQIAQHFGRVTFLSDHRADMARVAVPSLIVQCDDDAIAPVDVGRWMHANMPGSVLEIVAATGHCPHMTVPEETIRVIRKFLDAEPG